MSQLIEFETAKLAKEKGFNNRVLNCFDNKCEITASELSNFNKEPNPGGGWYSRPTQDELSNWLREKHRIYISVNPWKDQGGYGVKSLPEEGFQVLYEGNVVDVNDDWKITTTNSFYKSYEKCYEKVLVEGLKLIP